MINIWCSESLWRIIFFAFMLKMNGYWQNENLLHSVNEKSLQTKMCDILIDTTQITTVFGLLKVKTSSFVLCKVKASNLAACKAQNNMLWTNLTFCSDNYLTLVSAHTIAIHFGQTLVRSTETCTGEHQKCSEHVWLLLHSWGIIETWQIFFSFTAIDYITPAHMPVSIYSVALTGVSDELRQSKLCILHKCLKTYNTWRRNHFTR